MFKEKAEIGNTKYLLYMVYVIAFFIINSNLVQNTFNIVFLVIILIGLFKVGNTLRKNYRQFKNFEFRYIGKCYVEIGILIFTIANIVLFIEEKRIVINFAFILAINALLLTFRILELCYREESRQAEFFAAINQIQDINQDISIFWKLKIWFDPHFDVKKLKKRGRKQIGLYGANFNKVIGVAFILVIFLPNRELVGPIIFGIIILLILFRAFDFIFKTYVLTEGICIDSRLIVNEDTANDIMYRIVDFNKKREIDIMSSAVHGRLYVRGDKVAVIHGAVGKMVLHHYKIH